MAEQRSLTTVSEADYEAIAEAVMETARGRWFLAEYARRNRTADTQVLLDAIGRLEHVVTGERAARDMDRLRFDLTEMAKAIARTKDEISAADHADTGPLLKASEALDGIVRQTEQATSDILEAAEFVQEAAWTLREDGARAKLCDDLDQRATDIYTACSFQDLTAQRMAKIIQTLRYLEGRINAMIDLWGGERTEDEEDTGTVENEPADLELSQGDVDLVIREEEISFDAVEGSFETETSWEEAQAEAALEALPEPVDALTEVSDLEDEAQAEAADETSPEPDPLPPLSPAHFAEIDALSTIERLRRFT